MRRLNVGAPRIAGLLALALGAVALLALSGVASAKDRHGNDHGHHGHHHHFQTKEAGTVSSFDATTGKLTIVLLGGESVTGMVTDETRIDCREGDERRSDRRDHGSDDNGGQGTEPGDDNGGHGNEPGDDNGGNNSGAGESGEGGTEEASCTVASLVPGAVVGEAELRLEGGVANFTKVDLGLDS